MTKASNLRPEKACDRKYQAMILACIDPRFQKLVYKFANNNCLTGKYSQVTLAGASIGTVAPAFEGWHQTFWDNLRISIDLHGIGEVIVINHRDCGAARAAYGEEATAHRKTETRVHKKVFRQFRREMNRHFPTMKVRTLLMDLDGSYREFSRHR